MKEAIAVFRLIVVFWPIIEQLIEAIEDADEREKEKQNATKMVAAAIQDTLKGVA